MSPRMALITGFTFRRHQHRDCGYRYRQNSGGVSDLHGVDGIAVAAELNKGFISNGQSHTVTAFDLTFAKTAEIPTGTAMRKRRSACSIFAAPAIIHRD